MKFSLSEEQNLLKTSVRKFVERDYGFEYRQQVLAKEAHSAKVWQTFARQGWLGAGLPEDVGGFGGGASETAIILHELGRGLILEPFLAVAVLTASVLQHSSPSVLRSELLQSLIDGTTLPVLAHREQQGCFELSRVTCHAEARGVDYRISGRKIQVLGGTQADAFVVSVRTGGSADDESGISLFVLDANTPGLSRQKYRLIDGSPVCDLELNAVLVPAAAMLGSEHEACSALESAHSLAITGVCAQAVGAMERAIEITADYLKTRRQFGVPIGSFQALQHRLADMLIELEQSRAMVFRALAFLSAPKPQRRHAVAAAKAQVGRSAKYVGAQAIQLHGGIGMTQEYSIGHYFKYLTVAESLFGNTDAQLRNLTRLRALDTDASGEPCRA